MLEARQAIAVISDIHGNASAPEAVLEDMRSASPDQIFNPGDCLAGPFDPCRAADLQMSLYAVTFARNHERGMLNGDASVLDALPRSLVSQSQMAWELAVYGQVGRHSGLPQHRKLDASRLSLKGCVEHARAPA